MTLLWAVNFTMARTVAVSNKCPGSGSLVALEWAGRIVGSKVHLLTPAVVRSISRAISINQRGDGAIDFEGWYQGLLAVRRAHRYLRRGSYCWRECSSGCTRSYVDSCGDLLILLLSGMVRKYAKGGGSAEAEAENEIHLQLVLAEVVENYDKNRGVKFIFYVHECLRKAAPSPILSEGGETNYKVATVASGRERGLIEELGRDPSAAELYESTRSWFFASRISKVRGVSVEVKTLEQISSIVSSASAAELAAARVRLSRDGILSWFESIATFQAAIGRATVMRLDAPIGEDADDVSAPSLVDVISDPSIPDLYESEMSDMDRLLGLSTGRIDNLASAISMKLQDKHRHVSYSSVATSAGVGDVSKIKGGVKYARERSSSPVYQFAWLSGDLASSMVGKNFGSTSSKEFDGNSLCRAGKLESSSI